MALDSSLELDADQKALIEYIVDGLPEAIPEEQKRFEEDGKWYFRTSWMTESIRKRLISHEVIEVAGTYAEIRNEKSPGHAHSSKFYRINDSEINQEISDRLN